MSTPAADTLSDASSNESHEIVVVRYHRLLLWSVSFPYNQAVFFEDDSDDAGTREDIFSEGASQSKQQEEPLSNAFTPPPFARINTNLTQATAYSTILNDGGTLVHSFAKFCAKVRSSRSLGKAIIQSVECYRQSSGPVMHRFLLFHLRRRKRRDIWLRIDRQLAPNLTLPKFFARYFQSAANDSVSQSNVCIGGLC